MNTANNMSKNNSLLSGMEVKPTAGIPTIMYPIIFWVFLCVETLIIIFGNAIVVSLFLTNRRLRKTQTFFIISLCTSDMLVGLALAPCEYCRSVRGNTSDSKCPLFCGSIISFNMIASVLNLVLISTDRYLSIKWPFKYVKFFTKSRSILIIIMSWVMAVLLSVLPITWSFESVVSMETGERINFVYTVILFVLTIVAGVVLTVFYYEIVQIIRAQQLKEPTSSHAGVMVCIISTIVFAVSWIPYSIVELLLQHHFQISETLMDVAYFILMLSPCIDPIIYAYYRKDFRTQLASRYSLRRNTVIMQTVYGMLATLNFSKEDSADESEEEGKPVNV